ncbi:hypothetical protein PAHAL_7G106200 [Panicum hallii]|uniref:TF-B3 domain-containing protein n=1 Tax=Panicum hallii TaxID=206008 RepID=A0A2T8IBR3_9POAL|nr:hypothetical protein PAHAL_7G106200 [Panicum hallii]
MIKQLKVLMPPSFHKLPISDELAGCFDASSGGGTGVPGPTALVVSPFGKVWRVDVGRDGDGKFLGRGWADFLAAHGIDRLMTSGSSKGVYCKPRFLTIIQQDSMEEMKIPARFVKHYITEECLNRQMAVVVSPLGKFWRIKLQNDQSGVFFAGVWSQFLAFHGISEGEVLLLRYEGNMVFKFKVFEISGCQKDLKNHNTSIQQDCIKQESPSPIKKRKADNERASSDEEKRSKSSVTSLNNASPLNGLDYQIGPPAWVKKKITAYMLERLISLPVKFCHSIGFQRDCTITLKTAIDSTRSWQVRGVTYKKVCYLLGEGWKCFCEENRLKKGDLCTFHVIETMLWHVVITHYIDKKKESPCSSSMERKSVNQRLGSEEQLRPQGSMIYLSKASSYTRPLIFSLTIFACYFGESDHELIYLICAKDRCIPEDTNQYIVVLAQGFCDAIELQEPCMITLKTSINSTRSWLIRGTKQRNGCYLLGSGRKKFSQENELKVGDICTFNVVEISLWHVVITRA